MQLESGQPIGNHRATYRDGSQPAIWRAVPTLHANLITRRRTHAHYRLSVHITIG